MADVYSQYMGRSKELPYNCQTLRTLDKGGQRSLHWPLHGRTTIFTNTTANVGTIGPIKERSSALRRILTPSSKCNLHVEKKLV